MKSEFPSRDIQGLVEAKVGPVSHFEPLPEGLVSQTYAFRQGPAHYVVRVGGSASGYQKDAFAWRAFSSAAIPIPEVISVDARGDVAICISRRAPGVQVCDVGREAVDLTSGIVDLLAELARTSTAATTGFGPFNAKGVAPYPTWRDYLLQVSAPSFCDWTLARDPLDRRRIGAAILGVERLAPAGPLGRGLIHGDFGAANLLSDGQGITAVIDWDRAMTGDVVFDEANLFFWREPCLLPVLSHLSSKHRGDAEWDRTLLCYQLRICLQELSESLAGLNPVDLRWLFDRCAELTDLAG